MRIEAVIGANYGDEGKGLFTEYLCRNRPKPLVVLSNGGCQRGHTVNDNTRGVRHVFHHFGSGTLLGAPMVYSRTFLLNPIAYISEKRELNKLGVSPVTFRAPGCVLQLPCDMFVNQTLEEARGHAQHGSCGWGIWETQVRNRQHFMLTFDDFDAMDREAKRRCLLEETEWGFCHRLDNVKERIDYDTLEKLMSDAFCDHFISDFEEMAKNVRRLETDSMLDVDWTAYEIDAETLIVENGQGLLLDKKYAPLDENGRRDIHSTPSMTGLDGVKAALGAKTIPNITANYISRTYFTRHGAGPFPEETSEFMFEDKTNVSNEYQGSIRFGKMTDTHKDEMAKRILTDAFGCSRFRSRHVNLVFTHCNEIPPQSTEFPGGVYYSYADDSEKVVEQ